MSDAELVIILGAAAGSQPSSVRCGEGDVTAQTIGYLMEAELGGPRQIGRESVSYVGADAATFRTSAVSCRWITPRNSTRTNVGGDQSAPNAELNTTNS